MKSDVNLLLIQYLKVRTNYYRIHLRNERFREVLEEGIKKRELAVIRQLIVREFPQFQDQFYKVLMLL